MSSENKQEQIIISYAKLLALQKDVNVYASIKSVTVLAVDEIAELFKRVEATRREIARLFPHLFADIPLRELPPPERAGARHTSVGYTYYPIMFVIRMQMDVNYITAVQDNSKSAF